MEIKNLNELTLQVGKLDNAVETPLFYGNAEHPVPVEKFKGILNQSTGKFVMPGSQKYQIIQHNDVLSATAQTLGRLGMEVTGRLDNYRDSFKADLIFANNNTPVDDGEKGIQIGIRIMNSYNKTCSMRLEMFAFRVVCQNGMTLGRTMGVKEVQIHYGNERKTLGEIERVTELFIKEAINSNEKLQLYVDEMMRDSIEWDLAKLIIKKMVKSKKHIKAVEAIMQRDNASRSLTRWDVYNALTNYISHGEQLKPTIIAHMERNVEKLIRTDTEKLKILCEVS